MRNQSMECDNDEKDVAFEKLLERLEAKISAEQKTRICKEKVRVQKIYESASAFK